MRIRSIKPEFWRSEDVAALDWDTRLVFIGLWSYVDDNGVGRDVEKLILADLFPLEEDSSVTLARLSRGLRKLFSGGQITRYTVAGKSFLYITNWALHQKIDHPAKERYPVPTCENAEARAPEVELSRESRETVAPGTGEQGNRGTGEEETCSPAPPSNATEPTTPPGFAEFWNAYPRKEAKQAALKSWPKAAKLTSRTTLIEGAHRLAQDPNREDEFTPLPGTWLNAGRWEDDPLPARNSAASRPRPSTTDATIAQIQALKHTHPDQLGIA